MKIKIKNAILKIITTIAAFSFAFSACCMDSESFAPVIVCAISSIWLILFITANDLDGED